MPTLTNFIHFYLHRFGSPSHNNQMKKEIKVIQIGKEEVKLSLFVNDKILFTENLKDATKKLLELINELGKSCRI